MTSVEIIYYKGLEFIQAIQGKKEKKKNKIMSLCDGCLKTCHKQYTSITVKNFTSERDAELHQKVFAVQSEVTHLYYSLFLRRFTHWGGFSCQIPKSVVGRWPRLSFGCVQAMASQSCFQTDVSSWKFNEESVSKKVPFTRATEDTN